MRLYTPPPIYSTGYRYEVLTQSDELPVLMEDVFNYLKLECTPDMDTETEVRDIVKAVIADFEQNLGISIMQKTIKVYYDSYIPSGALPFGPHLSITEILSEDEALVLDTDYTLSEGEHKRLTLEGGLHQNLQVTMDVGFVVGTLPSNLSLAVKMAALEMYDGRDMYNDTVNRLIRPYRRLLWL